MSRGACVADEPERCGPRMRAAELKSLAREVGIDVIGAAPAAPYERTKAAIAERRRRGLFADMHFTMARPEVSCNPHHLLDGARTVISAALCYFDAGESPAEGEAKLPRYAWRDRYQDLRARLDQLGRRLGGDYRVLVDDNDHVDREGAARAGVGFYGKNTMLITERFGSWVVLGTLVTTVEVEPSDPLELDCGECSLCIDACPTRALDEPGTLDANRCLSYWTQSRKQIPEAYAQELDNQVYGCDICQEVCPWNRPIERERSGAPAPAGAEATISLRAWLEADAADLRARYDHLYFPRNDARFLKRNAIIVAGNVGDDALVPLLERHASTADPVLQEPAKASLVRLRGKRPGKTA